MNALPCSTLLALSLSFALSEGVLADPASSPTNSLLDKTAFAKEFAVSFTNYTGTSRLQDFPVLIRLSTAIDGGIAFPHVRGVEGGGLEVEVRFPFRTAAV